MIYANKSKDHFDTDGDILSLLIELSIIALQVADSYAEQTKVTLNEAIEIVINTVHKSMQKMMSQMDLDE